MNWMIKKYREMAGLTQEALAERIGTSQQQIQRLENGSRRLTSEWIKKLAQALDVSPAIFFEPDNSIGKRAFSDSRNKKIYKSDNTIPVYGYTTMGDDGLILNANFIAEYSPRPLCLEDVKEGFLVYVSSSSMEPRYFQGEKIAVHSARLPKIGEDCIVIRKDDHAFVRVYQGKQGDDILIKRYNPEGQETIKQSQVKAIYAIVGRMG